MNIENLNLTLRDFFLAWTKFEFSDFDDFDFESFRTDEKQKQIEKYSNRDEFEVILEQIQLDTSKENTPYTWTVTKSQKGVSIK